VPAPVTVVVPTHNRPELMARAVASVLAQTYEGELEVIVVFDACDPVLPTLDVGPGRSLRGLPNSRTRGLAGGRNTGILAAQHEFVAFLDDDDEWLPTKLERQMAEFAEHPEAALVGTAMVVDDGVRTHERRVGSTLVGHSDLIADRLPGLHSSSFVFRRSALLDTIGLVDEDLPASYGEDYDLLLRTASTSQIRVVDEPLVSVRWAGQSYFFGRWALYAQALQYLLSKHPGFADNRAALGRIEAQIAFALAAVGEAKEARRWGWRALRHAPRQIKAALAIAISFRLISTERVLRIVRRFGKGI